MGKAFLKSYLGVCMEGAIVVLACLIFSAFAASGAPIADTSLPVVTMSWQYVAQTIFNTPLPGIKTKPWTSCWQIGPRWLHWPPV